MRGIKGWLLLLPLLALSIWGVRAFVRPVPELAIEQLDIAQVKRGDLVVRVSGTGALQPEDEHWLLANTGGIIQQIVVEPGVAVAADTVLMVLVNPQLEDDYQQALFQLQQAQADALTVQAEVSSQQQQLTSDLAMAELDWQAHKQLLDKHVASRIDSEKARLRLQLLREKQAGLQQSGQARLQAARLKVEQQQARVDRLARKREALALKAGVDGRLYRYEQDFRPGMKLEAGQTVARIARDQHLTARVRVPALYGGTLAVGQTVEVSGQGQKIQGSLARIHPVVEEGNLLLDVRLPRPLPAAFKPGQPIRAQVETERKAQVLLLRMPAGAHSQQGLALYRVSGADLQPVTVQIGALGRGEVEVRSGAREGDWLVISDLSQWQGRPLKLEKAFQP